MDNMKTRYVSPSVSTEGTLDELIQQLQAVRDLVPEEYWDGIQYAVYGEDYVEWEFTYKSPETPEECKARLEHLERVRQLTEERERTKLKELREKYGE